MMEKPAVNNEDWVDYDFSEEDQYPLEAGVYDVIVDGSPQTAYFYGSGWWDSEYSEDDSDIDVEKWLRGSLVVKKPEKAWIDKSELPDSPGEYQVLIDAPWPLGGIGPALWTGTNWTDPDGGEIKITKWR